MTKISYFGDQNRLFWYAHPTSVLFNELGTVVFGRFLLASVFGEAHEKTEGTSCACTLGCQ